MPTICVVDGFSVLVYSQDHNPAHVHVRKNGADIRVKIGGAAVLWDINGGKLSAKEVRRAVEIVADNLAACNKVWRKIYG